MFRTLTLSILLGWAVLTSTACADPPVERWHSLASTATITWKETPVVQTQGASQTKVRVSGSGSHSAVYPAIQFNGTTTLPPGTKLYVFFTADATDSAMVDYFLEEVDPENWETKQKDPQWSQILKVRQNFLEVEVGKEGNLFFILDGLRSPEYASFHMVTLVDKQGAVLDRLTAGG